MDDETRELSNMASLLPDFIGWFRLSGCEKEMVGAAASAIAQEQKAGGVVGRSSQIRARSLLTSIGRLQTPEAMFGLIELNRLSGCDQATRGDGGWCAAISMVIRMARDPALAPIVDDGVDRAKCQHVRAALAEVCARLSATSSQLRELAESPVPDVRRAVAQGLSRSSHPESIEILETLAVRERSSSAGLRSRRSRSV
jgi:hypothetical protein